MNLKNYRHGFITMLVSIALVLTGCSIGMKTATVERKQSLEIQHQTIADCGIILDQPTDSVVVTLSNGHMFEFENEDPGEWEIGDVVTLLFDDNGTAIIMDDIIIDYRYSGHIYSPEVLEHWVN